MKYDHLLYLSLLLAISCKVRPGSDNTGADKLYKLRFLVTSGAKYTYEISNKTQTHFEVANKKVDNINKSDIDVSYFIDKDSSGNFLITIKYNKVHIYTKNGDNESEMDTENAASSTDPTEKMLGELRNASIVAMVDQTGKVIKVNGYQEIADKMMEDGRITDVNMKMAFMEKWKQLVEENFVRKNVDQIFKITPDSAVHIGDSWKLVSKQKGDLSFNINNTFILNSISDGIARIGSTGRITSDSAAVTLKDISVSSNMSGDQKGDYEVDAVSGMLLDCNIGSSVNGTMQMMGRDIPVSVTSTIKMKGKKIETY